MTDDARTCPDCRLGDDHCHGTLVRHRADDAQCMDVVDCDARLDRHQLMLSCRELQLPCAC